MREPTRQATITLPTFHFAFLNWLGRLDLNQRMRESKSRALPLGDAPMKENGADDGIRTRNLLITNQLLYH